MSVARNRKFLRYLIKTKGRENKQLKVEGKIKKATYLTNK